MWRRLFFTVNSAAFCVFNYDHRYIRKTFTLIIYPCSMCLYMKSNTYYLKKSRKNIFRVCDFSLWMSTQSRGCKICCLCRCSLGYSQLLQCFFSSVQLCTEARLTTPSAYNRRAADPEAASLTSDQLQGQHILHMSFVDCLMNQKRYQ